ncbi:hypothetical protein [Nocardioides dongxiaopingii]|uniref:hypothetical protein n=1 Tax=Nocardioides dongxiaopingii TaxID=2576036 RepID=UPI0010C7642F|nr:hypothetical protein [Nocardioides dongxiaopingii]
MTEPLDRLVQDATPAHPPPFADVVRRRRARRLRRRAAAGVGVAAVAVVALAVVDGPGDRPGPEADDPATSASDPASDPVPSDPVPSDPVPTRATSPLEPDDGVGDEPPRLVLDGTRGPVPALQGSYCWGSTCADRAFPAPVDVPLVAPVAPLRAAFPLAGRWDADVTPGVGDPGCARYPVLVEPGADDQLLLTPSGPGGDRVGSYFVRPEAGGDTSGLWRWPVPARDGRALAWLDLRQNTPSSGGEAGVTLHVDDAAVDGDVSASVRITAADGAVGVTVALPRTDQHCDGDGFVELGTPWGVRQQRIDGIGPAPYSYVVDLVVDGTHHTGTGTFAGGTGGGDSRITFDPPLPAS